MALTEPEPSAFGAPDPVLTNLNALFLTSRSSMMKTASTLTIPTRVVHFTFLAMPPLRKTELSPLPFTTSPSLIPMPLSADASSNLIRSLKVVQSLGEAVPHGGILKAVAGRVRQNKQECGDIARRAAEHIAVLKRLDEDQELSNDLIDRLERYHRILKAVLEKVERLGTEPNWKRTLRASSVQDETNGCLNRLNEGYQMYIMMTRSGETNEIPMRRLDFGEEIKRVEKKTYVLRIEHGRMIGFTGRSKAVILRRFEVKPEVKNEDRCLEEFKKEKPIFCENAWGREYGENTYDRARGCIFVSIRKFGRPSHRLIGSRQDTSFFRTTEGRGEEGDGKNGRSVGGFSVAVERGILQDSFGGATGSVEENAALFERISEVARKWSEAKTWENTWNLWTWLRWWSGASEIERETENLPVVGEIGWIEGKVWHPIGLVHQFLVSDPQEYDITASRWRDGEWETTTATQMGKSMRWSMDVSPGENVYLRTYATSYRTTEITDFFLRSALTLARDCGVDVRLLRLVSRMGFRVDTSLMITEQPLSPVHYSAYPPGPDGSVPDPPGSWSHSPDPLCSDQCLQENAAQARVHISPFVEYERINNHVLSILQELDSHGFLLVPDITYASDLPFASITEVSDQEPVKATAEARPIKRLGKQLLSAFAKKRKTSYS
ncbi:hypothetical protein SISNIDRAFT_543895 [Sistotremastrum niveocremeum HHB9708]|uniref:Uncharacterized protein n=1 Tax=Sistotremastrum niveocremeum HHB9708 TaxID=1314777 RepID=A0A164MCI4_9AGAM|nr:hypothetical protein SISNIDRAFT_543895 [Sistotremastrum niveocremeum HHB9708]